MYHTTAWPAVRPIKARMTIFRFFHLPNASVSGAFEVLPSAFILANAGDSFMAKRIHTEIPSRMTETRKGMRQPHASKSFSPVARRVPRMTISDRKKPRVAVVCIHAVNEPRLPSGACSAT
ncbi:hypothetical protein D3C72_1545280 [compost metagenome]